MIRTRIISMPVMSTWVTAFILIEIPFQNIVINFIWDIGASRHLWYLWRRSKFVGVMINNLSYRIELSKFQNEIINFMRFLSMFFFVVILQSTTKQKAYIAAQGK